jgi:hypothetical protein
LAESDSDHEPTSTVTIPTPPRNNTDTEEYVGGQIVAENKNGILFLLFCRQLDWYTIYSGRMTKFLH